MNIRDAIKTLAERWYSKEWVACMHNNVPRMMDYLTIRAWREGVHTGPEADLLREAWHRLYATGVINGEYP